MRFFWRGRRPGGVAAETGAGGGRARLRPRLKPSAVTPLEDRRLPAVASVVVTAFPQVLQPPDGKYLPVVITGTVQQAVQTNLPGKPTYTNPPPFAELYDIQQRDGQAPGPGLATVKVTDQYRHDEPRGYAALQLVSTRNFFRGSTAAVPQAVTGVIRQYTYVFYTHLQAQRSSTQAGGRLYHVNVFASDQDGGSDTTISVLVPRNPIPPGGAAVLTTTLNTARLSHRRR